ncbi:tripartite tricarboxylate transporter substrate binding protein BugD [Pigmentiphaga soli]|uniref:Tripartite tricarboxylate transporter substrate binding protein BugD n=1 Tax=Pigmentiphaga soli TaxID=1007095 RepID=A0ABP8GM74_9BURK
MKFTTTIGAAVLAIAAVGTAHADGYPSHPVTMLVPSSVGGPTDALARILADSMAGPLGNTLVVETKGGGASGTIGASMVAKAPADGYTILLYNMSHATTGTFYDNLPYEPRTVFQAIGLIADVPMVIVGRPDLPASNLQELIAYLRSKKDGAAVGHAGPGTASQLCSMLLQQAAGVPITSVAYKGAGPAMVDLMAGHIDLVCDQTTTTLGPVTAKRVKAFAVTSKNRVAKLPDLPTASEAGLPGFEMVVWHGLYAPKGTPEPVVAKLEKSLQTALEDPKLRERLAELGAQPVSRDRATPEALQKHLEAEIDRWAPIIRKSNEAAQR